MLEVLLLGRPQVLLHSAPLDSLLSKTQALLFYIAVSPQPQTRDHLAELLWPSDSDATPRSNAKPGKSHEHRALSNLRHEIELLRRHLSPYVNIERDNISFNRDSDYYLDIEKFDACFPRGGTATLDHLENAARLYRGAFLDQFSVRSASDFEMWVEQRRAHYELRMFAAYERLIREHTAAKRYAEAHDHSARWRTLAPQSEEPHRAQIVLLALSSSPKAALAYYERYKASAEFSAEMDSLRRELEAGRAYIEMLEGRKPAPSAPPAPEAAPKHRPFLAPRVPPAFVGRERELAKVRALLSKKQAGLVVAIVGMGGIGKTSAATKLAHDLRDEFPDGVLWADLATSSPMSILEQWGDAYGTSQLARYRDLGTRANAFRDLMTRKRALLILDDVTAAAQIPYLLPSSASNCVVLMTARNRDIPNLFGARSIPLRGLKRLESMMLLARIVGEMRVRAEMDSARSILKLLEGLPLAIDITAQRINREHNRPLVKTLQQLESINSRLSQLKIADTAVRTSFERSWEPLDSELRRVFALMAVFESRSFSRAAIAYTADISEDDADEASISLCQLSLLSNVSDGRYRLHALMADYAREKLDESGESAQAQIRMARYYQHFAQDHTPAELDAEWGSIMAGVRVAYAQRQWRLLIRYSELLEKVWFSLGHFSDARQVYQWLCSSPEVQDEDGFPALAKRLSSWGLACIEQSDYDNAHDHLTRAHEIYDELRMEGELARTKGLLGRVAGEREDFETSEPLLRESWQMCEARGDWVGAFEALYLYADIPFRERRYEDLYQIAGQLLNYTQLSTFLLGNIKHLGLLADIATAEGKYDIAEQYCAQALAICDELQEQSERSVILNTLANTYRLQKRYDDALELLEKTQVMFYRMGDIKMQARTVWRKATIYFAIGQPELSLQMADDTLRLAQLVSENFHARFVDYRNKLFNTSTAS